jgi:hypothetical protein
MPRAPRVGGGLGLWSTIAAQAAPLVHKMGGVQAQPAGTMKARSVVPH